jgi:hypothetical protein
MVILPVLLYGCETWPLTLREEHKLRVLETRLLRKIFWSKRDEVTGDWKKLHSEQFHHLYSSLNIIRVIKSRNYDWQDVWHVWMREVVHTGEFGGETGG